MIKLHINKKSIALGATAIVFLSASAVLYFVKSPKSAIDSIANNTITYINQNLLQGQTASLVSAVKESGLIKIKLKIGESSYDSYVSDDGRFLFTNEPVEMKPVENKTVGSEDIQKSDSPVLNAFVVSRCPYGLQMQRILADVIEKAPSLAPYISVRYMGTIENGKLTAMHGEEEAAENLRQICIRDEQPTKYWSYVSCQMKAGDTKGCEATAGVDSNKLNSCLSDANKGLAYAKVDVDLNAQYGDLIKGSPTLILNDKSISEFDFGGRTSDALKNVICAGFNNQPEICSVALGTDQAAANFSQTYKQTEGTENSGTGGCAPAK